MVSWDIPWSVYSAAQSSSKTMLIENRLYKYIYSFWTPFSSVPWPNTSQYTGRHNNNNITILCAMCSSIEYVWRLLQGPDDDAYILNAQYTGVPRGRLLIAAIIAFRSRRWNIIYFYDFPRGTGKKFALRSAASIINAYRRGNGTEREGKKVRKVQWLGEMRLIKMNSSQRLLCCNRHRKNKHLK